MTKETEIDIEKIGEITLELTSRFQRICSLFPRENQHILRHLAAASIHTAFFMRDLTDLLEGKKSKGIEKEDKFLNECGCDFNKMDKAK